MDVRAGADPADSLEWHRPSGRLRSVRRVQLASAVLPLAALGGALGGSETSVAVGVTVAAALVVAGLVVERLLSRRVGAWAYAERQDDLLVRRGLLFRRLSVVPYGRMQYIDVTAGPFERSFGLATVRMHTAAAASDARIPGLPTGDAMRLRDQLAALGDARSGGL